VTQIKLNDAEQELAVRLASMRHAVCRKTGVKNSKIGPQSNFLTDLIGIGGELAVAKALNVYPDLTIFPRVGGADLVSRKGARIDVKTTDNPAGRLLVRPHSIDNADIYILVIADFPEFDLAGYATKEEVFSEDNEDDLGHGATFVVERGSLKRWSASLNHIPNPDGGS